MSRDRLRHLYRPGWLEILFWSAGCVLIAGYAGVKYWSEWEREQTLQAFRQMQSSMQLKHESEPARGAVGSPNAVGSPVELSFSTPDMSAWSSARRSAWSKLQGGTTIPRAVLAIDAVDLEVPVFAGVSEINLTRGAAHIEGTSLPGNTGNSGIAAHRDGYFRALRNVQLGERVTLHTLQGELEYRVTRIEIVDPSAMDVLAPTPMPALTLITCYPFYYVGPAPQRFIVRAEQVRSASRSAQLASHSHPRAH